jgi:hypothetical protein
MYTMKESVAVAKEADAKKGVSPTKSDNSILRLRDEPERQLGSLRGVIANITRNGGTPSVESIATELSGMSTGGRAPALLALQQTHGNRYVQRVVAGIQAKLKVGQPGDVYEREADRVADAVMRMPEPGVQRQVEPEGEETLQTKPLANQITPLIQVQRQMEPEEEVETLQAKPLTEQITPLVQRQVEEEEEEFLQAKELSGQTSEISPNLEAHINTIRGGGQPLPASTRTFFEPRFGYDFSQVRVHTDAEGDMLNHALNARAFTTGLDIFLRQGEYNTGSSSGLKLMAHELTHVIQQRGIGLQLKLAIGRSEDKYEQKADRVAQQVTRMLSTSYLIQQDHVKSDLPEHLRLKACEANDTMGREADQITTDGSRVGGNSIDQMHSAHAAERITHTNNPLIQRFEESLEGWVGGPDDDSAMTINMQFKLFDGQGQTLANEVFTSRGQVIRCPDLQPGRDYIVQIIGTVQLLQDRPIYRLQLDLTDTYIYRRDYPVTVDQQGNITILPRSPDISGGGNVPWSLDFSGISDSQGNTGTVGLGLTLRSTVSRTTTESETIGGEATGEPGGIGVGITGEVSTGEETSTSDTSRRTFGLHVELNAIRPAPRAEIEMGPVEMSQTTVFSFETSQPTMAGHVDGVARRTVGGGFVAMNRSDLRAWFLSLDLEPGAFRQRGAGFTILVEGHASPVGENDPNGRLSERRIEYIIGVAREVLPGAAVLSHGALGEEVYAGRPETENRREQRIARVTVIDRRSLPSE